MAKVVLTSRVAESVKNDLQTLAEKRKLSTSEMNELILNAFIKQQKEKGVI